MQVETAPAAAVVAAEPAPTKRASTASNADLQPMLDSVGLVWVNTDANKLRAAQESAAHVAQPVRAPRQRKVLPPVDATPMEQVETHKG
jgi:ribonuclease E